MRRPAPRIGLAGALAVTLVGAGACTIDGTIINPDPTEDSATGGGSNPGPSGNGNPGGNNTLPPNQVPAERPIMPPPGANPPGSKVRCDSEAVAPRVLRRLTNAEFEATVRAAFGLDANAWQSPQLVPDPASGDGFTNNTDRLVVGEDYEQRLMDTGKLVADQVTSDAQLARILPCAATGGDACATTFLDGVGAQLFRRPLLPTERARYLGLLGKVKDKGQDFKSWVYWATVALVKSPSTIYRSELGEPTPDGKYRLGAYEVASALAYAYTGGPPNPALLQLAAADRLASADDLEAAARQLVYAPGGGLQPAFRAQVLHFADQWLGLSPLANISKDQTVFPDFSPEVQDALGEELVRFISGVLFDDKGKPADLFLAPFTYLNATLAHFYGYGQGAGNEFVRMPRPANTGVGLVSQGGLLAIAASNKSTSPTKRGHLIRERFLCMQVPPPPPVVAPLPEPTAAETTRQRYEKLHVADPACKTCHALMDQIGFGLEHLDATGRYRDREGQFDIDDSGKVINTSAGDIVFKGASELSQALARLPEVSDCMADFASAYTFGLNHISSACLAKTANEDLRVGKIGFVDFLVRMARAESFRTRLQ